MDNDANIVASASVYVERRKAKKKKLSNKKIVYLISSRMVIYFSALVRILLSLIIQRRFNWSVRVQKRKKRAKPFFYNLDVRLVPTNKFLL